MQSQTTRSATSNWRLRSRQTSPRKELRHEESEAVRDAAPEGAASGAPEDLALTGDSPEAELPPADYEQDLGEPQQTPEPAVAEGD